MESKELRATDEKETPLRFAIDTELYLQRESSLEELLKARRCPASQKKTPTRRGAPTYNDHLREISTCCSKQAGYLADYMPVLEVIFRILIAGKNQPRTAAEIYRELSAHLVTRTYSRVLPVHWIERMLSAKNQYDICPL